MSEPRLTDDDRLQAELYGLKAVVLVLLHGFLEMQPDPRHAAQRLETILSNTIDRWDLRDLQEPKLTTAREAMRERALAIISSASNPGQTTSGSRP